LMSLLEEVPIFYWISSLSKSEIEKILIEVVKSNKSIQIKATALNLAIFLGKASYTRVRNASGDAKDRLGDPIKGTNDRRELFHFAAIRSMVDSKTSSDDMISKQLTDMAKQCSKSCGVIERAKCWAIDCHLYSKDRYPN